MKRLFIAISVVVVTLVVFISIIFAIVLRQNNAIPTDALKGGRAESADIFWSEDLDQFQGELPNNTTLKLFSIELDNGETENRAFIEWPNAKTSYLGNMSQQFTDTPIQMILVDIDGHKFFLGYVEPSVEGSLKFVDIERYEENQADWMKAVKSSVIYDRVFVIPIFEQEETEWELISGISINTKESLKNGIDGKAPNGSEWETVYTPPVDIKSEFIIVKP